MIAKSLIFCLLGLNLLLCACIPSTRVTIELGNGYALSEMDSIDSLLEKQGFSRSWFSVSDGERIARIEREGKLISAFATEAPRGFGASVIWTRNDGALAVEFGERNTGFSEDGKRRLQRLIEVLRARYGERIAVSE